MESEIELALMARLSGAAGLPAIAWPNVDFGSDTLPRLEVALFRNDTQRLTIGGKHRRPGILQITVCTRLGIGAKAANQIAETVAGLFPHDLRIATNSATVRVTKAPTIAGGFPDDAVWRVPVSIEFETLA